MVQSSIFTVTGPHVLQKAIKSNSNGSKPQMDVKQSRVIQNDLETLLGSTIEHLTSVSILEHACDSSSDKGSVKILFPSVKNIKTHQTSLVQGNQGRAQIKPQELLPFGY